jgi:hypothetical protein
MRRHLASAPLTSTCTNAPVSFCTSQGAVRSQARRRTITSPARSAWPGFIVRSREMPFRLLSSPSTATRSAIGVSPFETGASAAAAPALEAAGARGLGLGEGAAVDTGAALSF